MYRAASPRSKPSPMDPLKWILPLTISSILALSLFLFSSPHLAVQLLGQLNGVVPDVLAGWSTPANNQKGKFLPVKVNLSTCLHTFGRPGKPVYCCPPKNVLDDPIIDFQFPDPATNPIRVRRSANRLDKDSIAKYEKAVALMRSLPYSDPRSYTRQANLHCQYCTGSFLQENSELPVRVHKTWIFFPWHRMLLYFHERILGSLIGDDTFAIPFWPWDLPEGMTLPAFYLNGSFKNEQRDPTHYPPAVADLDFQLAEGGSTPGEQVELNLALMYNQMVSGAKTAELFMGCAYKTGEGGDCFGPGTMERAPHNTIHKWVGSAFHTGREDMGVFYSAARDPSFYAHHSNIDRLWEVWMATHPEMNDPEFLDSTMYFYDEKLRLNRIRFRDVMEMDKLRYRYEDVVNTWMTARPKPSVTPRLAKRELRKRVKEQENRHLQPTGQLLDYRVTFRVVRPRAVRTRKEKAEFEEILVVEGIDVKAEEFVKFDVYINVVNGTIMSPKYREFAGTFTDIPMGVSFGKKTTLELGISEVLEDLEADRDPSIWVTLMPRTESCNKVTIDGLSIKHKRK
ncbi:Aureusidin synthase [Linum grandiflorum]